MVTMDLSTWQDMRVRDPRRLSLGGAQWGMPYGIANRSGPPGDAELQAMLARAHAAGVRAIDTARAYGESETRIGRALEAPHDWRIVTKLAPDVHEPGLDIATTLERAHASLEASRTALGLDVLPVFLLHRFAHRHACGGRLWRMLLAERDDHDAPVGSLVRVGLSGIQNATDVGRGDQLESPVDRFEPVARYTDVDDAELAAQLTGGRKRMAELGRGERHGEIGVHGRPGDIAAVGRKATRQVDGDDGGSGGVDVRDDVAEAAT